MRQRQFLRAALPPTRGRSIRLGTISAPSTPAAMVAAQCVLVAPLMTALARQTLEDALAEYDAYLRSLHATKLQRIATLIREARFSLLADKLLQTSADECAGEIIAGLERGSKRIVTGHRSTSLYWLSRLLPNAYPAILKLIAS